MKLSVLIFILSVLVPLNTSQTSNQDVCSKRGEVCLEVNNCVNGKAIVKSQNYTSCSVKNFVPGICCKNAINPATTTHSPVVRVNISSSSSAPPLVKRPVIPSNQPPTPAKPSQRPSPTPPRQTAPSPRPNSITTPPKTSRNSTAVALENCQKYAQYKFVTRWKDPDLPGQARLQYTETDCVAEMTLIVNGQPTLPKEYPHMALMGYGNQFQNVEWNCGGSLISENFILSAAHCSTTSTYGAPKWVLLGDLNIASKEDDALPAVYSIIKVYDHPNYDKKTTIHDIALFQLNTTVKLGPYVRPACLYTSTFHPVDTRASITGWGLTGTVERKSDHLLKATISVATDWRCTNRFQDYNKTTMICAGDLVGGKDTCPGDSGGPLQVINTKETCLWDIIGITSYGDGICGNNEYPSVFTNVAVYLDWIQNIVWP